MWTKGDILYITYFPDVVVDLAAAKKILEDRLKISNGKNLLNPWRLSRSKILDAASQGIPKHQREFYVG